jgi:hypothetical protein
LGLKAVSILGIKKKKTPHPDANKMEKQVQSSDDADRG